MELDLGSLALEPECEVLISCEARRRFGGALDCDKAEVESWLEVRSEKKEHTLFDPLLNGLAIMTPM